MRSNRLAFFALVASLAAAGCAIRRPLARGPGDSDIGVDVIWHGHACFTIGDSTGRQFFIDPFDETVGYTVVWEDPDAVFVTDDHFDHNAVRKTGRYDLVRSTGVQTAAGIEVTGLLADHDDQGGAARGFTRIYIWEMGGLRFADLGGIGQTTLRPDQREALKNIDVLFVPVGGQVTVDGPQAAALVEEIAPKIAVPMQYGNEKLRGFTLDPLDPFLDEFENVVELPDNRFQVRKGSLPETTTIYVPALPD
jgi:L-ascorbate metabolism protein UlaG (beta-lactamase superfamily)